MNRWDMVIGKPAPPTPLPKPKKKRSKSRARLIWEEIYQKFSEFEKDGRRVGEIEIPKNYLDIISKKPMTIKTSKGNKRAYIHTDYGNYATLKMLRSAHIDAPLDIWGAKIIPTIPGGPIECYEDLPF